MKHIDYHLGVAKRLISNDDLRFYAKIHIFTPAIMNHSPCESTNIFEHQTLSASLQHGAVHMVRTIVCFSLSPLNFCPDVRLPGG